LEILSKIEAVISKPAELSPYAPRITSISINPEKIRLVIGSGGKTINEIIDACGVEIDIDDDGLVMICGIEPLKVQEAVRQVKEIVHVFEAGEILKGKVVRILDFGAFVELNASQDGMVHVSELAPYRVEKPSDLLNIGDIVTVKIKEIDDQGRINLSMKGLSENEAMWKDEKGKSAGNGFNRPSTSRPQHGDSAPRKPRF